MAEIADITKAFENSSNILDNTLKGFHCGEDEDFATPVYFIKGGYCITVPLIRNKEVAFSKCLRIWWKNLSQMKERNSIVCDALRKSKLKYFINYEYIENALNINGKTEPGIRMDWIGKPTMTMSDFLKSDNISRTQLEKLASNFFKMCVDMNAAGFAHGDLSSSNILVNPDISLMLVDYDSMYVPNMGSRFKQEIAGTPGYQHPRRFNEGVTANSKNDYFSQQVIYVQLLAFAKQPRLCSQTDSIVLLFNGNDLASPQAFCNSAYYKELYALGDADIQFYLKELAKSIGQPLNEVKSVCDLKPKPTHKPESPRPVVDKYKVEVVNPSGKIITLVNSLFCRKSLGEYCAFCRFKITDGYPDAKFCPNCGCKRIECESIEYKRN